MASPARSAAHGPWPVSGAPGHAHRPRRDPLGPAQRAGQLGAARAHQARQAQDLPGPDVQRHVVYPRCAQATRLEHDRRLRADRPPGRERRTQGPAQHRAQHGLLSLVRGGRGAHQAPVAQDRYLIGEFGHFAQEMRDQDDGRAAGREPPDDLVQPVRVGPGKGGGRLVHDDQPGVTAQRAQDLHLLLIGGPQAASRQVAAELEARRGGELVITAAEGAPGHEAGPARLGAEEDVLRDRQRGRDRQLLGDQDDPADDGLARGTERDRLPADQQLTAIGGDDAGQDLAQRRLPRAVLADERVDRPLLDRQADPVQGPHAAEGLGDVRQLDVRAPDLLGLRGHLSQATRR